MLRPRPYDPSGKDQGANAWAGLLSRARFEGYVLVLVMMCRWAEKGWLEIFVTRAKGLDQFLIRNI